MLLGTELGVWCAFFGHYCLRDFIYSHIRRITSAGDSLPGKQAWSYFLWVTLIASLSYLCLGVASSISYRTNEFKQLWLINLRDACGMVFEEDEDGTLLYDPKSIYTSTVVKYATVFGLVGLFAGQLLFRTCGFGKLYADAFTSKTIVHQILYGGALYLLNLLPEAIKDLMANDLTPVNKAIFKMALPKFVVFFMISFLLPVVTMAIAQYPEAIPDLRLSLSKSEKVDIEAEGLSSGERITSINGKCFDFFSEIS